MKAKTRTIVLQLKVIVPVTTGESDVERAINAALDEPPCDWGEWIVCAVLVTDARKP